MSSNNNNNQTTKPKPLKIFFHAFDAIGHLNACAGLGQILANRGHKIYFLLSEGFAVQFTKYGFEEIIVLKSTSTPQSTTTKPENPIKAHASQLASSGMLGPGTPLQKMVGSGEGTMFGKLLASGIEFNPQIEQAIERVKPDLFILDHFIMPPAVQKASLPWVYLCSGNPLRLYNSETDKLPPFGAGLLVGSDPTTWSDFLTLWAEQLRPKYVQLQQDFNSAFNFVPKLPVQSDKSFSLVSPYLSIYGFPKELDYADVVQPSEKLLGLDTFCRMESSGAFDLPKEVLQMSGDKLIYVSLGSLGSIDVDLMKRIVSVLGKTAHKYIVSKGQLGDEYELPDNCWGDNFLPQTRILPIVVLVITHGGNNTITETFSFGKPMIVMPLFGDQYDNAQRVQDKAYGIRIEPYSFTEAELLNAISKLLHDTELHQRLQVAKERMHSDERKQIACKRIEMIAQKYQLDH